MKLTGRGEPSAYLLLAVGADTIRSLVELRLQEGGWGVHGRSVSGQAKHLMLQCFSKSQNTLNYPANTFSFALFLIGFLVQIAKCRGLLCFFSEVPNSNFESSGVLGSCSVFSRIPTEH